MMKITAAVVLAVAATSAQAGDWWGSVETGVVVKEEVSAAPAFKLKAGYRDVYVWGQHEDAEIRWLGQGINDATATSFGIGVQHRWDRLGLFIEGGYVMTDSDVKAKIQDEMVYTVLVNNHENKGRPIPADDPAKDNDSFTTYELGDGAVVRLGVSYEITKHIDMSLAYRWMTVDESYTLQDTSNVAKGGGWWQENVQQDLSGVELSWSYSF